MILSKACQHAIRALVYIQQQASEGESTIGIKAIASGTNSPAPITAKILKDLVKHGLINSKKGPGGGFSISTETGGTNVIDVVLLLEGKDAMKKCPFGIPHCSDDNPCPAHNEYKVIRAQMTELFEKLTIEELSKNTEANKGLFGFNS